MKIVSPSFVIETRINGQEILRSIEKAGRTAYKSENKMTSNSAKKFVSMIIARGHFSVIEHKFITVRIICDRGLIASQNCTKSV